MFAKIVFILYVVSFKATDCQFGFPYNFGDYQQPFFQSNPYQQQRPIQNRGGHQQHNQNIFNQNWYPQNSFQSPQIQQNKYPNQPINQQDNQRPGFQNNRPTRPPVQPTQTQPPIVRRTSPKADELNAPISQRKCNEYAKLIQKRFQVASLSIDSVPLDVNVEECDAVTGLVVGGKNANAGEFPHMAAIGYPDFNGGISFKCGGTLISDLFVLTAAHCKTADRTKPSLVRLGDLDLKVREKKLPEVDVPIKQFISHESYNKDTRENDIALIKLMQAVTFSKDIRPACLPQTESISKPKVVATGWGYTEVGGTTSDILQKVQLDLISNQKCTEVYNDDDNYNIYPSQMCAGILAGGADTCGGDSGGPLQVTIGNQCLFSIIGITSYGSTYCGAKNSPGIYTRVSSYINWIEAKVWAA